MKRVLKTVAKWTSTAALVASLYTWWLVATYQGLIPGQPFIQFECGQVTARFFIPVKMSLPDWSERYVDKNPGDWGWGRPQFVKEPIPLVCATGIDLKNPPMQYRATIPMWLPTLSLALVTGFLWKTSLRRPPPPGHCPRCRYNLTANTTGICPECGLAIQHKAT